MLQYSGCHDYAQLTTASTAYGLCSQLRTPPTTTFLAGIVGCLLACSALVAQDRAAEAALRRMETVPELQVSLVASEPLVRQPVAIEFDDRGRLWVIQYLQYPNPEGLQRIEVDRYSRTKYDRVPEPPPHGPRGADRITILEDRDGDGVMDQGRDFVSGLNLASGLAFGHGGLFVLNVPYLLFYPDQDRDDQPDSDPQVLLAGFGMQDAHSVANSLCFGPDGWLYGCQGSTVTANIRGIEFQQGVWRYHPPTDRFELFCEGGGNSWGLDFDAIGELFYSTNYGGYVMLHGVQGGYFVKSFAKHGPLHNPFAYGYFEHVAHDNPQGGHVTSGGIVYQADALPARFRDQYIAADLLGHTIRWHNITAQASTVRTRDAGALLVSNDSWFAPCDVTVGPDGAVYVADWHDARTAHPDPDAQWDRSNGRIYRIAPPKCAQHEFDLADMTSDELIQLHDHANQFFVRRARQEMVRRGDRSASDQFRLRCLTSASQSVALESLWTLNSLGGFDEALAAQLLDSPHQAVRKWAVRLLGDWVFHEQLELSSELAHRLDHFAEVEQSIMVRQQLACTAARLPAHQALPVINANINRDIDFDDQRLPLLWWWAIEHHCNTGREEVMRRFVRPTLWNSRLGSQFLLPRLVRRYMAEGTQAGLDAVVRLLQAAPAAQLRTELWPSVLAGWQEQSSQQRDALRHAVVATHPLGQLVEKAWHSQPNDVTLTRLAIELGNATALEAIRSSAFDSDVAEPRRIELLRLLGQLKDQTQLFEALALLRSAISEALQLAVLEIVAHSEDPQVAPQLIDVLKNSRYAAISLRIVELLFSRRESAKQLLAEVQAGEIPADRIPLDQARRVALLGDPELPAIVVRYWGQLQAQSAGEILAEIRRLNNDLRAGTGHASAGQVVFRKHCASCHQLFGQGTKLGPDLTTANRQDHDFLLTSLVDPNYVIRTEYVNLIVHTVDGRVLSGLPVARDGTVITLADAQNQHIHVNLTEVEQMQASPVSMMPADLYKQLSPQELRDLFAYLQSTGP
ncbi:MAG: c-type cytochrome [Pirellulaceae bacterium]|nr:c-type cytochrome [Pirellulaceae bacterium]